MPSWWGRCGAQSSVVPLSSSVEHCCWRGEGPGLIGGDCDLGTQSGAHPAGQEVWHSCGPRRSSNDNDDGGNDNEDDYDYTTGDLSLLAALFGDGVGADAQIPTDNIILWRF